MNKLSLTIMVCLLAASPATAAKWNVYTKASTEKMIYFFDSDTIVKKNNTVVVWNKYIKHPKHPDYDGSYSTTERTEYSCSNRTYKILSMTVYDKDGEFIRTIGASKTTTDIIPDTLGESILKTVCAHDFPKNKSKEFYNVVKDNDINKFAEIYFNYLDNVSIDYAPSTKPVWYVFNEAYNEEKIYYFDLNSIYKNNKNNQVIWIRYVANTRYPEKDGSRSTGYRAEFSCTNRTIKATNLSIYDNKGKFMSSYLPTFEENASAEIGSLNDIMLSAVCSKGFPQIDSTSVYQPVDNNDIYNLTNLFFDYLEAKKTDPAPK